MVQPTFYWHDFETFGRDPRRDRPVQFAGLRTNADLKEIGDPLTLYCRPAPDSLPDPESVLLTGILPQNALAHGVAEHAFAAAIESELARDGTIGVGYNSIRFDDEVTRHLFWRSLIDPYAREWQNGCGRWDLMDVLRCTWALRPEGIEWPRHTEGEMAGRPSFKLEHLTQANGISHESAHDALSDVRATLALARLIKATKPQLWDFCLKLHKKDAVWAEIGVGRAFLHLSTRYPVERGCLAIVWPLAAHPKNKNELIVWDLSRDPRELEGLDAETVRRRLFTRQDELAEGELRLPIKTIHVNRSPIVIGNLRTLGAAGRRWGLDIEQAQRHALHAAELGPRLESLWPQVFIRPEGPAPDVDEDLYGGFIGNEDRRTLQRLRELQPGQLASKRPAFHDARLSELLFRYRARNFSETLSDEERSRWQAHCSERLHQGAGGAQSLKAYFDRIEELTRATTADSRNSGLLQALSDYGHAIAPPLPS